MIWIILAVTAAILFWYYCVRPLSHFKRLGVKQTNPIPFFGDQWKFLSKQTSLCEATESMYNMFPRERYFGFYQFTLPTLCIRDPDLLKQIAVKDFDHFTDHRTFIDPEVDPLFGQNLFALRGQRWREMRATLSGTFTSSKMKTMFHLMDETAKEFVKNFANNPNDLIETELKDAYTKYTNDVIATTAFGIQVDSMSDPQNEFYLMGKEFTNVSSVWKSLKFFGFFVFPKLFKILKIPFSKKAGNFFTRVIKDNIKAREEQGIIRPDMLNLLLETRKGIKNEEKNVSEIGYAAVEESPDITKFKQMTSLTDLEITSQALIFFLAGFDTISTALCFGSYELAFNTNIQDKLRQEIIDSHKANNEKLTYETLKNMKYLDMVVSEILRKWPSAVAIDRVCTKPYTIQPQRPGENPVPIKVGDVLWIPMQGIHRDPENYEEPEKFIPERFSDENKGKIKPYTNLPFGVGPRNCIGSRFALLEIKVLLYHLLRQFKIVPIEKTVYPIVLSKTLQHGSEGGFWLGLKKLQY